MRVRDGLVVQMVGDDRIVIVDDHSGFEIDVPVTRIADMALKLDEAHRTADPVVTLTDGFAEIEVAGEATTALAFGLGYFYGIARERGTLG